MGIDRASLHATAACWSSLWYYLLVKKDNPDKTPLNAVSLGELKRQRLRTGLGSRLIAQHFDKNTDIPTATMIDNWLSGRQSYAIRAHYEYVLMTYLRQPNASADGTLKTRVLVTDDIRAEIREIHARSATGYLNQAPQKFSASQMSHLLNGRTKKISTTMLDFFRYDAQGIPETRSLRLYPPSPDITELPALPERPMRKYKQRRQRGGFKYVDITDQIHKSIHAEILRTRISPKLLLESGTDVPDGLNAQMVRGWHSGKIQATEPHYLDYVLKVYRDLPDA